jgi:hypothetical protein
MTAPGITPNLAQVLQKVLESRLSDLHVALPGRVERYDHTTQTADVQPQLRRLVEAGEAAKDLEESLPVIPDVPVMFPRSGEFFLSMPIQVGDFVLLVFNERSIDLWREQGREVTPTDDRMHSLAGAVAIPGLFPSAKALTDARNNAIVMGKEAGPQIHLDDTLIHLGQNDAAEFVAQAQKTLDRLSAIVSAVNSFYASVFNVHFHGTGVGPSAPPSVLATSLGAPASVAATKVKVE